MPIRRLRSLGFTAVLGLAALAPTVNAPSAAFADSKVQRYTTKGTIKELGPTRLWAKIAHEDIPGFMAAMTMKFETDNTKLLAALAPGDRVAFTFEVTATGRLVITAIAKA